MLNLLLFSHTAYKLPKAAYPSGYRKNITTYERKKLPKFLLPLDQPTLIRQTRSGNCDSECSSDGDCAGASPRITRFPLIWLYFHLSIHLFS